MVCLLLVYICLVDFFDESREHIQQENLEPEDEFSTLLTANFIKIPVTVLRAW